MLSIILKINLNKLQKNFLKKIENQNEIKNNNSLENIIIQLYFFITFS